MILVLDNYDSFVHNVARYLREIMAQGGGTNLVRVVRSDEVDVADVLNMSPSHLVISPGPCTPSRAGISVAAVRAVGETTPVLGICLGHQAVAEAYGGRVVRARRPLHGRSSTIHHEGGDLLDGLPRPFRAGRYHSLVVDEASLPPELMITARSEEGEIMAIRHRSRPVWGIQFHPESILTPDGHRILRNFLVRVRDPAAVPVAPARGVADGSREGEGAAPSRSA